MPFKLTFGLIFYSILASLRHLSFKVPLFPSPFTFCVINVQVPNLKTGKMEPLITGDDDGALTKNEEQQFRSMVNRLHTIFKVSGPFSTSLNTGQSNLIISE